MALKEKWLNINVNINKINKKIQRSNDIMKNEMETKVIDFEGGKILGVRDSEGKIWMGIKNTYLDLGLSERQAKYQVEKIGSDIVLSKGVRNFVLPSKGGKQNAICLYEDFVTLWLAKITLTPKMQEENPDAVKKLIEYQLKAAKVLHNAFMGTEGEKKQFYDDLGLSGRIDDLTNKVEVNNDKISKLNDKVGDLITNSTINSRQSQKLLECARNKIRQLLGNAHSSNYKKYSRVYFKNLWLNFCDEYEIGSYKDLCPIYYKEAFDFIENWTYKGVA